jgi:hypothetical protein
MLIDVYGGKAMDKIVNYAPALAVTIVAIGLAGYVVALVLAAFFPGALGGRGSQLAAWFIASPAQNLGLPSAALCAFAIVAALLKAFPLGDMRQHDDDQEGRAKY